MGICPLLPQHTDPMGRDPHQARTLVSLLRSHGESCVWNLCIFLDMLVSRWKPWVVYRQSFKGKALWNGMLKKLFHFLGDQTIQTLPLTLVTRHPHFWDWPLLTYLSEESWESRMFSHHLQNFLDFGIWKSCTKTVSLTLDSGSILFFKAWGQSAVWSLRSVIAAQGRPTEVTPWLWSHVGILPVPATLLLLCVLEWMKLSVIVLSFL